MVLVDSSVWIAYFKGTIPAQFLHTLIDTNTICINDLILAELVPSIIHHEEFELKDLLLTITNIPLKEDWNEIIEMQTVNLKNGINNVGIADLLIAQHVKSNDLSLFSLDRHFQLMSPLHNFKLCNPS